MFSNKFETFSLTKLIKQSEEVRQTVDQTMPTHTRDTHHLCRKSENHLEIIEHATE